MIEILNWNTGLTEGTGNILDVINYVNEFLEKENTIAVLQQIPFKIKDCKNNWVNHRDYEKFMEAFSLKKGYVIFKNDKYNNGYIFMQTVIITKMNDVIPANIEVYPSGIATNRESGVIINNKCILLGLHATAGKNNEKYLKSINENSDIIVGDFNAGDYQECDNWKLFRSIISSHVCICNLPTKCVLASNGNVIRKTCIDHIFVKREFITKCSDIEIHEDVVYSDHYPITFKIDI